MSRDATFLEAQTTEWLWKTDAMQRMAIALVTLALGHEEFAADDLPATLEHGGHGIAGSIMSKLADNGIITRVGVQAGAEFYPKMRGSKAEGRKGSPIGVWRVADRAKAESFLRHKHSVEQPVQQPLLTD